jgi:hypothetical protein
VASASVSDVSGQAHVCAASRTAPSFVKGWCHQAVPRRQTTFGQTETGSRWPRRPSECPVLRIGEKHLNGVDGSIPDLTGKIGKPGSGCVSASHITQLYGKSALRRAADILASRFTFFSSLCFPEGRHTLDHCKKVIDVARGRFNSEQRAATILAYRKTYNAGSVCRFNEEVSLLFFGLFNDIPLKPEPVVVSLIFVLS